jgi:hypothetical protein
MVEAHQVASRDPEKANIPIGHALLYADADLAGRN